MMRAVRFFWIASPLPGYLCAGLVASVVFGIVLLHLDPFHADSSLATLLFLQMFMASSGFRAPASRGHYDPILVSGVSRPTIAAAHWLDAAVPGLAAWIALGVAEFVLRGDGHAIAFQPPLLVALSLVSIIPWACSLPLARLSGGAVWTCVLIGLFATREGFVAAARAITTATAVEGVAEVLRVAGLCALCPFLLLGRSPAVCSPAVLVADVLVALAALVAGVEYVKRREYPLVNEA
jgi:hypothetical protein